MRIPSSHPQPFRRGRRFRLLAAICLRPVLVSRPVCRSVFRFAVVPSSVSLSSYTGSRLVCRPSVPPAAVPVSRFIRRPVSAVVSSAAHCRLVRRSVLLVARRSVLRLVRRPVVPFLVSSARIVSPRRLVSSPRFLDTMGGAFFSFDSERGEQAREQAACGRWIRAERRERVAWHPCDGVLASKQAGALDRQI